jgi:alpha-glucosidase (family GH31 glycosyl hydrolase)
MPTMPNMPVMTARPMPMMTSMTEKMELQATGQKTNLLGFACQQFELKQRGETLEIWATDQLLPYQPYMQNQPRRFGPSGIEEQWPAMLTSRKLFPLLASLRYDNGAERFRFEVKSVTPQKLTADDAKLFQPPSGWFEIQPLPF